MEFFMSLSQWILMEAPQQKIIPLSQDRGRCKLCHNVITTNAGLWRYKIGDTSTIHFYQAHIE